jgi:hypothetical protein
MCKGLSRDLGHDLVRCLFGYLAWIFGWRSSNIFLAEVFQSSSPNFWVARSRQNQCCVLVWGSFTDFCCTEVLELHWALKLSSTARA